MEIEVAKKKLKIEGEFEPAIVKAAYIQRVKETRDDVDFEQSLLDLNIARDTLLEYQRGGEVVPVLKKELATISAKQNELMKVNEARDEIRDALNSFERRSISQIKGSRDFAGLLSALYAALAFGRENISEFFPLLADTTLYSQILLLSSAIFALIAFLINRRATQVSSRIDEIKRNLTRDRVISRLLTDVFYESDTLEEFYFLFGLEYEIKNLTVGKARSPFENRFLKLCGALGFPVPIRINLGRDFVEEYTDYLLKSGHVTATGVSGHDMIFHKTR